MVRGILGISSLILRPPRWLGGKKHTCTHTQKNPTTKKNHPKVTKPHHHSNKKGPYLQELLIWVHLPAAKHHIHTSAHTEGQNLGAVTLANLRSAEHSCGAVRVWVVCLDPWLWHRATYVCFFFYVPDHLEKLWFYTAFCFGGFSCLFFYVSPLILNRQLTELKFRASLKGQILKSACMISDHKSHCTGSG